MPLFPVVGRKQPGVRVLWWGTVFVLSLGILLHLLPFYFMITSSFKPTSEVLADVPTLWPQQFTLAAWKLVFSLSLTSDPTISKILPYPFLTYFWNSLFMAGVTLLLSLPITALAAYANSKLQRGPVARWLFLLFIGTLMVPVAVTILPKLLLTLHFPFALTTVPHMPGSEDEIPTISIWDTPWAVILPAVFNAFGFLVFKGFFDSLPDSVIQAARVDGGTEFNIFRRIVLPMSIPVFAVVAWTQFSAVWDDFLWPLLAFRDASKFPMSVAIYNLTRALSQMGVTDSAQAQGQSEMMRQASALGLSWNGLMVLAILQTIPVFLVFLICRRYLLSGIRIRGLK